MNPFQEATYEQLGRLLVILDYYKDDPRDGLSVPMMHQWACGARFQDALTTEFTLAYWEQLIIGETPDNPHNSSTPQTGAHP